jgi:uncharacterized protein (TIGR03084 family)
VSDPTVLEQLVTDLEAETEALNTILVKLDPTDWSRETPSVGWTIHDQVSHLAFFDDACALAVTSPDRYRAERDALVARGDDFPDQVAKDLRALDTTALKGWFRQARSHLLDVLVSADGSTRIPWYGPDMNVTSAATARLMETWAHGRDIADAVGAEQPATDRLRHIAHLGVRTRGFSYAIRDRGAPDTPVRVELTAPSGTVWDWGPENATDRVTGPAEDFCLVVAQRRHLDDTRLLATGEAAAEWLDIAQAFAGAPGPGRPASTTLTSP